jgi:hypothetical protein
MILGRPLSAWTGLVAAIAAFVVVVVTFAVPTVDITQLVAGAVAVAGAVLALIANKSVTGSLLGARK